LAQAPFLHTPDNLQSSAMAKFALLSCLMAGAAATELTLENFEAETGGKTVFIKFQAPW